MALPAQAVYHPLPGRRANAGPAIRRAHEATEASLLTRFRTELPHRLGPCNDVCKGCNALHWKEERPESANKTDPHAYTECCQGGQIELPVDYEGEAVCPPFLEQLLTLRTQVAQEFKQHIRMYNNALSFTSLRARVDKLVNGPYGVQTFRIQGALAHRISGLNPDADGEATFAQVYVVGDGGDEELESRLTTEYSRANNPTFSLNRQIMRAFQDFMYIHNPFARMYKHAGDVLETHPEIGLRLMSKSMVPGADRRRYNRPSASEVAMIVEGDGLIGGMDRDVLVYKQQGGTDTFSDLHNSYFALRYPLLLPYGTKGYDVDYRMPDSTRRGGKITNLEWFARILFSRPNVFSAILAAGLLFQELLVDMYVCVEHWRLQFIRNNQVQLRAALYSGVVEALGRNDLVQGKSVILPSSFVGGPRNMTELYHDAMALRNEIGEPGYFITMTTNPQWPEILAQLRPGETPQDRPDIIARVFNLKFHNLLNDVYKQKRFGKCLSYVFTIEFQKRSLPHAHLILIMDSNSTLRGAEAIGLQISADIPCPITNPRLHDLVGRFMIHGPCKKRPCWRKDACKYGYPRAQSEVTQVLENAYPLYKRPVSARSIVRNGRLCTSRDVVPYNPYLLLRFECHINVEIPVSVRAVKYLYKYIAKGHDRSAASFVSADEIIGHIDGRYVSASEACWRLFKFPMSGRYPAVQRLALHLEDAQNITWADEESLEFNIESGRAARTTLTEYFRLNREGHISTKFGVPVSTLLYRDMPKYFTWSDKKHEWKDQTYNSSTISRTYFASIYSGERYYLRLLLANVRGATSFVSIRTVNGMICSTYRRACHELGLLLGDEHYAASMTEAASWQTGSQLRNYFALLLKHSPPANPHALWLTHKEALSDDCERAIAQQNPDLQIDTETVEALGLHRLRRCLAEMDMTLDDAGLPAEDTDRLIYLGNLYQPRDTMVQNVAASQAYLDNALPQLNRQQKGVFEAVTSCLANRGSGMFYLDGPGGTGKTFVLNALLHHATVQGIDSISVASSGVAALLLLRGETAHSGLKIPLNADDYSSCNFTPNDKHGRRVKAASLLIWDEIAMQNKADIHCVDRGLRDLRGSIEPFGGMCVLFSGDFRQTMPVVPHSSIEQQANASFKRSKLWPRVAKYALHENLRMRRRPGQDDKEAAENVAFSEWLLRLGNGDLQEHDCQAINVDQCNVSTIHPDLEFDPIAIREHYEGATSLLQQENWKLLGDYYAARCILTPLNKDVTAINNDILNELEGDEVKYLSLDIVEEEHDETVSPEILNSHDIASFPKHDMRLKPGVQLVLLRNLNLAQGLCNGTRLVVTKCGTNSLRCRIVSGQQRGKMLMLPKIKLLHTEDDIMPVSFYRYQFPVALAFAMTINKAQGQSLERVLVSLPNDVFSHGQLYVALSRCTTATNVSVAMKQRNGETALNIVHQVFLFE